MRRSLSNCLSDNLFLLGVRTRSLKAEEPLHGRTRQRRCVEFQIFNDFSVRVEGSCILHIESKEVILTAAGGGRLLLKLLIVRGKARHVVVSSFLRASLLFSAV